MSQLIESLLIAEASAVTPVSAVLKVIRTKLPNLRRDELMISLCNAKYELLAVDGCAFISGFRLSQ